MVAPQPCFKELNLYKPFTGSEFGELLPSLVYRILVKAKLTADSIFLDLGCGAGNVVAQASLQCACKSYGVDIEAAPITLALQMIKMLKSRCKLGDVPCGDMQVRQEDLKKSQMVNEMLPRADLILFNNRSFLPSCLSPYFSLDSPSL
ncbi:histone methylation DOT1 [Roridomyces roridus]|uniref:Histone-lysine N-methyltransferase, H3 lysine-79 specific n=1 Tax=Roridomyces roridus TaxID=1738132 RepID=A0AAD7C3K7_9AGAR|nr:histone methylation DOT1 [Roridomyces roridus]